MEHYGIMFWYTDNTVSIRIELLTNSMYTSVNGKPLGRLRNVLLFIILIDLWANTFRFFCEIFHGMRWRVINFVNNVLVYILRV